MATLDDLYTGHDRIYLVQSEHPEPRVLIEFVNRVVSKITRDGYVIMSVECQPSENRAVLGAIPWAAHPSAMSFWLQDLPCPYEPISAALQQVLDDETVTRRLK